MAMAYFRINGYASDCERTLFIGTPTNEEAALFHHMMNARQCPLDVLKDGVRAADVDSEAGIIWRRMD